MVIEVNGEEEMKNLGAKLGSIVTGGEVFELIGDVGAGKTTFVKGFAKGLGIDEDVQSPSFTISRVYDARGGLLLAHYDFYRLNDPGIMSDELSETVAQPKTVTVIEWADVVEGVLPSDRIRLAIEAISDSSRRVKISGNAKILEAL